MESLLVTGGAGYKGIVLVKKLLDEGYKVTLLDNFMFGYEPVLNLATHPNLNIVKSDIRNKIENLNNYDIIFHLAGISGFPACAANPHSAQLINIESTKRLANSLSKDQLLIYASTTSLYGKSGTPCNEDTPIDPISHYARTKYEAEIIVQQRENSISLRFATVFGISPKMRMDLMINDFTYKAVKESVLVLFDSFAKRTFLHVSDAADAYIFAMRNSHKMRGQVYNAGGNHLNYSKKEIADQIKKKIDFRIIDSEIKDKDLRHFIVDFNKLENLGFLPKVTIEDGINQLIKVFNFYEYYSHYKTI